MARLERNREPRSSAGRRGLSATVTRRRRSVVARSVGLALMVLPVVGCASAPRFEPAPHLPAYPWEGADAIRQTLVDRAAALDTAAAWGAVVIEQPGRDPIALDVAMVYRRPDAIRLRLWKMGRPLADVMSVEGRQFLWLAPDARTDLDARPEPSADRDADVDRLAAIASWLTGFTLDLLAARPWMLGEAGQPPPSSHPRVTRAGDHRTLTWRVGRARYHVDSVTRLIRQVNLGPTSRHGARIEVTWDAPAPQAPLWPMALRVTARGARADLTWREVELNQPHAPGAFVAPRDARETGSSP